MSDINNLDSIDLGSDDEFDPFAGEDELDDVDEATADAPAQQLAKAQAITPKQVGTATASGNDSDDSDNPFTNATGIADTKAAEKAQMILGFHPSRQWQLLNISPRYAYHLLNTVLPTVRSMDTISLTWSINLLSTKLNIA